MQFTQEPTPQSHSAVPLNDEQLIKILNGAIVGSHQSDSSASDAGELQRLLTSPAMGAILRATRIYATEQQLSETAAAESIVQTLKNLDRIWKKYLIQEGIQKLRSGS